ncbi:MAG: hypothetical protein HY294_15990 [Candidatus Rokubacteria bacterium]|nr:hypothetical protein [Candidatus Rokubacteria bacterium]
MSFKRIAQAHAIAIGLAMTAALASGQTSKPVVTSPTQFAISPPQSQAPPAAPAGGHTIIPVQPIPHPPRAPIPDPALQTAYGPLVNATPGIQFDGVGANGWAPSDANLAVGPNHIVHVVNVEYAVYSKSGLIVPGYPKALGSIFSTLGAPCNGNGSDPIALYDRTADRWLISVIGLGSTFKECIAVSTTNDPTGAYALYSYDFGTTLNDYPKLGVWPTASNSAYLATYNLFANAQSFVGADLCAYDRAAMLAASPTATQICFPVNNDGGFLPSDAEGPTAPPAGSPGYFLNFPDTSHLNLFKLSPNFASPPSSTFTGPTTLAVAAFSMLCGGGTCVPQSGTSQTLDSLGDRLMYRLAYRKFADHEALVTNHSVTAGTGGGVRWYELRDPNGAVNVFQQGTFAPDANFRWMGSIGTDKAGDIAMGYSVSSSSVHPGINYTGREPGDAAGTMQSDAVMLTGTGSQTGGLSRWGDYSAIQIDPIDDCTFWYTTQYLTTSGSFNWSTRIGSFAMNNCTGVVGNPDFSIAATPPSRTTHNGSAATYTVTIGAVNGFTGVVTLALTGQPPRPVVTFSPPTVTGSGTSTLTVDTARITRNGTYTLRITGTSGALTHSTTVNLVDQ